MKKVISVVLALFIAVSMLSGCALVTSDDSNVVIATVNGKPILKEKYNEICNYYIWMYTNYYGYDAATAASSVGSMKTSIIEDLIQQEVLRQKAEAEGYFNFTDEQRAEAQKTVDEDKEQYVTSLVEEYTKAFEGQEIKGKNEGETNEDYFKRIAEEKYLDQLEENGTTVEQMLNDQLETLAIQKFQEDKLKDVTVLEADAVEQYNTLYDTQLQELSTDSLFVNAWNQGSVTSASGETVDCSTLVYYRPGYSLVQQILVKFGEEDAATLQALYQSLDEYDEEIADRKATLETETDEALLKEAEDALKKAEEDRAAVQKEYDEKLELAKLAIQDKVDTLYNDVKDGDEANFIAKLVENTEDTGMNTEEAAKKGYLVGPEDGMVKEFSEAATSLEEGKVSEPVATYYGYHIIRCMKTLKEGKVAFDDVKEDLITSLTETKKDTEWNAMLEQWKTEAKIKKYENRA